MCSGWYGCWHVRFEQIRMSKHEDTNFQAPDGEDQILPEHRIKSSGGVASKHRLMLYALLTTICLLLLMQLAVAITLGVISSYREDVDFKANYNRQGAKECRFECKNGGYCQNGQCQCRVPFYGEYCKIEASTTSPLAISVEAFDNATISVRWEPQSFNGQPVSGYKLVISPVPTIGPDTITTEPDVDGATFTGLISGTNHVIALEAQGTDVPNSKIEQYTSPNTPTNLRFDEKIYPFDLAIQLHWSPPTQGNAEWYRVYQYTHYRNLTSPTATPQPRKLLFDVSNAGDLTALLAIDYDIFYRWDVNAVVGKDKDIESDPVFTTYHHNF